MGEHQPARQYLALNLRITKHLKAFREHERAGEAKEAEREMKAAQNATSELYRELESK